MPSESLSATAHTSLKPDTFWRLLADPAFYARWSEIRGIKVDEVDAPPGLASTGTAIKMRGTIRRIPYSMVTVIVEAERPRVFEARSEMRLESRRSLVSTMTSSDRYAIAPDGTGSTVTLTTTFERGATMDFFLIKWFLALHFLLIGRRAFRGALNDMLRSAERFVEGPQHV